MDISIFPDIQVYPSVKTLMENVGDAYLFYNMHILSYSTCFFNLIDSLMSAHNRKDINHLLFTFKTKPPLQRTYVISRQILGTSRL